MSFPPPVRIWADRREQERGKIAVYVARDRRKGNHDGKGLCEHAVIDGGGRVKWHPHEESSIIQPFTVCDDRSNNPGDGASR